MFYGYQWINTLQIFFDFIFYGYTTLFDASNIILPDKSSKDNLSFVDWIQVTEEVQKLGDGSIIECYWEKYSEEKQKERFPKLGEWKYLRRREDKTIPNVDWVVKGIIESLDSNICENELRGV